MANTSALQQVDEETPLLPSKERREDKILEDTEAEDFFRQKADDDESFEEKKTRERMRRNLTAAGLGIALVVFGVLFGYFVHGYHFLTSLYVITQIVTTVGYGDFTVHEPSHKLYISFYAMALLILFAYYLNIFAQKLADTQTAKISNALKGRSQALVDMSDEIVKLITATLWFACALAFGTIFYANFEACTCSYGSSFVEGCKETSYKECKETGGFVKGYVESWYMSVVTLLTIGFGDHTPRSMVGRAVGVVWMFIGVALCGNFVGAVSEFFFAQHNRTSFLQALDMGEDTFNEIDINRSGDLSRGEFLTFMLQQYGLVPKEVIKELNEMFDKMDKAGGAADERVTWSDIKAINTVRQHASHLREPRQNSK